MSYLVTSFIEIARCISGNTIMCDSGTTIQELITEDFDSFDFEVALTSFEATHRVAFKPVVWDMEFTEMAPLTIEEFLDNYVDPQPQRDPLFVTKRMLILKDIALDMSHMCDCECEEISDEENLKEE